MNTQQRRLFFVTTATSNTNRFKEAGQVWKRCFRPWGRIAVILSAALLVSCTSLTPDRVNVIAAIAGQAAAVGASEWLAKHPEHRASFDQIIAALSAVHRNGNTNEQALENAFIEFLSGLPTSTLRGPDGELYVAGDGGLVVWDEHLKKSVVVRGEATRPVLKATLVGLKRAMAPKPPAPVVARARRVEDLEGRAGEGDGGLSGRSDLTFATRENVALGILGTLTPTNQPAILHDIRSVWVTNSRARIVHSTNTPEGVMTNLTASTFDVTLNEHGIQQVNVRWVMAPNAFYTVQRKEDKDWEGYSYAQNTNTVATPWVWTTLWPAPVAVGQWRVLRR